jgi:hypothetical protein
MPNSVRADVYLTWDGTDLGYYTVSSLHVGYCIYMGTILNTVSSGGVTEGAHPVNFQQVEGYDAGGGVLHFYYTWGSSTGNLSDLSNCTVNENVAYPGTANPYYWPDPPWAQGTPNPTVNGIAGTIGAVEDDHYTGYFASPPYSAASFTAVQTYRYSCYLGGLQGTLLGRIDMSRSVSQETGGAFTYTGSKSGVSASCTVLNCTQGP